MEVINKGIGTLLEEHWDARGRGIEERESLLDTWENQLRTRQEDLEEREAKVARLEKKFRKAKNDEVDQPEEGDEGEGDYSEGLPTGDWRELCQHCASTIAHAKDRAGATPTAFTTVGNVTRTGSSTGTKAATGNRRRLPKAARAARAARASSHADESAGFRLLIMMKTTAMPVPLCPQVLKVGMHAHSSDSFRRVALSTESSSGMQQL